MTDSPTTFPEQAQQSIWDALDGFPIVMLTDNFGAGLRSRPMGVNVDQEEGVIWFLTDADSAKVDEVARCPQVCVTASHDMTGVYLSITGNAAIVVDRAKIKELWSPANKAFWDGPEDPSIVLVKVTPTQAQLWNGDIAPIAALKLGIAAITGGHRDLGEVTKVEF